MTNCWKSVMQLNKNNEPKYGKVEKKMWCFPFWYYNVDAVFYFDALIWSLLWREWGNMFVMTILSANNTFCQRTVTAEASAYAFMTFFPHLSLRVHTFIYSQDDQEKYFLLFHEIMMFRTFELRIKQICQMGEGNESKCAKICCKAQQMTHTHTHTCTHRVKYAPPSPSHWVFK